MKWGSRLGAIAIALGAVACTATVEDVGASADDITEGGPHVTRSDGGALSFHAGRAARVAACHASCADADGDGLVDAWEASVLEHLRPTVTFDEGEPLLKKGSKDVFASLARVAPVGTDRVLVNILLLYTRDFGAQNPLCFHASSHAGDVEHVALELQLVGTKGDAVVRRMYTTGHEGTEDDQSRVFEGAALGTLVYLDDPATGEPRWNVYASRSKHATYATKKLCESSHFKSLTHRFCLDEDCSPDGVSDPARFTVLPPVTNAGEPAHHLVDALDALGFPGEAAWTDARFCGGLKVDANAYENCPPPVKDKIAEDPFAG